MPLHVGPGAGCDFVLSDEHAGYRWIDPAGVVASNLTPESVRVIGEWAAAQL
ncbi:hypothetical protein [Streptosporangium longisporum]|uniref:hypothetical protein n=1 Tax=Streptosporangium longisporum TaxID=46187 RepID=UPI0031EC96BA